MRTLMDLKMDRLALSVHSLGKEIRVLALDDYGFRKDSNLPIKT